MFLLNFIFEIVIKTNVSNLMYFQDEMVIYFLLEKERRSSNSLIYLKLGNKVLNKVLKRKLKLASLINQAVKYRKETYQRNEKKPVLMG